MTIRLDIEKHGPLFTKDIKRTIRENARAWLEGVAEDMEEAVQSETPVGPTGNLRRSIIGRTRALNGKKWQLTAVASATVNQTMPNYRGYATWVETGVRKGSGKGGRVLSADRKASRAAGRGRWMFRRAAARMRASIKTHLLDLTKGLS